MGGSDSKLNSIDICQMAPYIQSVKGLPSSSASLTDVWKIQFDSRFDNIKAYLKMFISISSFPGFEFFKTVRKGKQSLRNVEAEKYYKKIFGLSYEINIYSQVIDPIVQENICPNFVEYLDHSKECTLQDLARIAKRNKELAKLSESKVESIIAYNMQMLRQEDSSGRPSITDLTRGRKMLSKSALDDFRSYRYSVLMTEDTTQKDYYDFLEDINRMGGEKRIMKTEYVNVLFQCVAAIYTLALAKTNHNDLHFSNIVMQVLPRPEVREYQFAFDKGKITSVKIFTKYVPKIYDFDRSYSVSLGENLLLDKRDFFCDKAAQCNSFSPGRDLAQFFCNLDSFNLFRRVGSFSSPADLLAVTPKGVQVVRKVGANKYCHMRKTMRLAMKDDVFSQFDIFKAMRNVASVAHSLNKADTRTKPSHVYKVFPSFFSGNGKLISKRIRDVVQKI